MGQQCADSKNNWQREYSSGWLKMPKTSSAVAFMRGMRRAGAKFDAQAQLIWVVNAFRYDPPDSSKVVLGWKVAWNELPECSLKNEAREHLEAALAALPEKGEEMARAFRDVHQIPHPIGYPMPSTNFTSWALAPGGTVLGIGEPDGQIKLWSRASQTLLAKFQAHDGEIVEAHFQITLVRPNAASKNDRVNS